MYMQNSGYDSGSLAQLNFNGVVRLKVNILSTLLSE